MRVDMYRVTRLITRNLSFEYRGLSHSGSICQSFENYRNLWLGSRRNDSLKWAFPADCLSLQHGQLWFLHKVSTDTRTRKALWFNMVDGMLCFIVRILSPPLSIPLEENPEGRIYTSPITFTDTDGSWLLSASKFSYLLTWRTWNYGSGLGAAVILSAVQRYPLLMPSMSGLDLSRWDS